MRKRKKKMDIVLASRNKKKIKELRELLECEVGAKINVLSLDDVGYTDEIEENGKTFEENSFIKASVPAKMGYISVADDSGLVVDALNGEPGIYSARYSGGSDKDNNALILKKLKDVPYEKRTARFVSVVTCIFPDGDKIVARGECEGIIGFEEKGESGFGYDPLFFYPPFGRTFAESSPEEKNSVSHRGNAMRVFAKKFAEKISKKGI